MTANAAKSVYVHDENNYSFSEHAVSSFSVLVVSVECCTHTPQIPRSSVVTLFLCSLSTPSLSAAVVHPTNLL